MSGILPKCAFIFISESPRGTYSIAKKMSELCLNQPKKLT